MRVRVRDVSETGCKFGGGPINRTAMGLAVSSASRTSLLSFSALATASFKMSIAGVKARAAISMLGPPPSAEPPEAIDCDWPILEELACICAKAGRTVSLAHSSHAAHAHTYA